MESLSLKLIYTELVFLTFIKCSTSLERCDSNSDCDEGLICCKIRKMCVSKCSKACQDDSDCGYAKCCDSTNTCTETNCTKTKLPDWAITLIVVAGCGVPFISIVILYILCSYFCPDKEDSGSSTSRSVTYPSVGGVGGCGGVGGGCGAGGGC